MANKYIQRKQFVVITVRNGSLTTRPPTAGQRGEEGREEVAVGKLGLLLGHGEHRTGGHSLELQCSQLVSEVQ